MASSLLCIQLGLAWFDDDHQAQPVHQGVTWYREVATWYQPEALRDFDFNLLRPNAKYHGGFPLTSEVRFNLVEQGRADAM